MKYVATLHCDMSVSGLQATSGNYSMKLRRTTNVPIFWITLYISKVCSLFVLLYRVQGRRQIKKVQWTHMGVWGGGPPPLLTPIAVDSGQRTWMHNASYASYFVYCKLLYRIWFLQIRPEPDIKRSYN